MNSAVSPSCSQNADDYVRSMMNIDRFPGYVICLKSLKTENLFPSIVFSADVDFVTNGLISLTSEKKQEIVVSELNTSEFNHYQRRGWIERINREVNRSDLRDVKLLRTENDTPPQKIFESVSTYLKRMKPSKCYYQDITTKSGEAIQVKRESISEFIENGGKIIFHKVSI